MLERGVSWRRAAAVLGTIAVVLVAIVAVFRSDGFEAVDATVPRATRWFVHQATGQIVLADGFAGRPLARLDTATDGDVLEVVQSSSGVALIDRSSATARSVDASGLKLGPRQPFGIAAQATTVIGIGQAGLVGIDTLTADAVVLPPGGDAVPFSVGAAGAGENTRVAPDGAIWTLAAGRLVRATSASDQVIVDDLGAARFVLVGNRALVLDATGRRVRFGNGDWIELATPIDTSEIVLQESGPRHECGWLAGNDDLWCVGERGIVESVTVPGLDVDGPDRLAIAGDAAALIRAAPSEIIRFDWRSGRVLDDVAADVPPVSPLSVSAGVDLIWVDQLDGRWVWSVHPWGIQAIAKNDATTPLLGESGEVLEAGRSGGRTTADDSGVNDLEREPDDDGIDDPPVAVDDPVTARTGAPVPVAVTANDYDPDGEAIVLVGVGEANHGSVEIVTGTTVVYRPDSGFSGLDEFEYTIADGNGTTASARVTLELLPTDAPNGAPVGAPDRAETGPNAAVVIDVLLNDIDPERDSLRISSFTPPDVGGTVTEVEAASGLPALRYEPATGASGVATFTYRPVDSLGAVGEQVTVEVEIAQPSDDNRPPIALPDAARVRRGIEARVPVLANDRDPDGDRLRLSMTAPLPPAVRVSVDGNDLIVVAQAGSDELIPFVYTIDDGRGHEVFGSVLVAVIADIEPNRPPIANADAASAVALTTQLVDVLLNDSDPDGDPLILVGATTEGAGTVDVQGDRIRYTAPPVASDEEVQIDRFTYTISDGNGHEVDGEVTVRVLPEPIAAPPFARDDAATTEVDVPVSLDVLRNDGDPSGERPTLVGTPGCAGLGTVTVSGDSTVTYTPPAGVAGVFTCTYEVTNSQGLRAGATIVISVLEPEIVNAPPVVTDESVTVLIGEAIEVDVLANDIDPDGPATGLRVLSSTTPVLGQAIRDGGVIRFEAGPMPGVVAITYQVGDELGGVSSGRLVIRVREPDPEPPVALDDARTITGPGVATSLDVLANDDDPDGDPAALRILDAELVGGDGVIDVGASSITFVPVPEFVGDLVVEYRVVDTDGLTAAAVARLTVLEAPNRPPVANDDVAEVVNGGFVVVPVAFNDADPDGDPLTFEIVEAPDAALGTAQLVDGSIEFTAVPGAAGEAVIVYRIDDGEDADQALVRIAVLPCAVAPPEAPNVSLSTGYEQPIAVDLTTWARNGDVVEVGPPLGAVSGIYTPPPGENGNVSSNYVVRNSCRIQAIGLVTIDVNQDPIAQPVSLLVSRTEPMAIPVTTLATDIEPLRITSLDGAPPWVSIVDDQRALSTSPGAAPGNYAFFAIVTDPGGLQALVSITLIVENQAPIAQDDVVSITGRGAGDTVDVVANDTDPDLDLPLRIVDATPSFVLAGTTTEVEVTIASDTTLRLKVRGKGFGSGSFTYTVADRLGAVAVGTVAVTVNNAPPDAPDVEIEVPEGTELTETIDAVDPEGHAVTLAFADGTTTGDVGDEGEFTVSFDGTDVTVIANAGEGATVEVAYVATDEFGAASEGLLTLVTTAPPPPTTTTTTTTTTIPTTTTTTTVPTTTTTTTP